MDVPTDDVIKSSNQRARKNIRAGNTFFRMIPLDIVRMILLRLDFHDLMKNIFYQTYFKSDTKFTDDYHIDGLRLRHGGPKKFQGGKKLSPGERYVVGDTIVRNRNKVPYTYSPRGYISNSPNLFPDILVPRDVPMSYILKSGKEFMIDLSMVNDLQQEIIGHMCCVYFKLDGDLYCIRLIDNVGLPNNSIIPVFVDGGRMVCLSKYRDIQARMK